MIQLKPFFSNVPGILLLVFSFILPYPGLAQYAVSLDDLDAFEKPGKTWRVAGDAIADLSEQGRLTVSNGNGVLVNLPTEKNKGQDLYTKESYGDLDVEVEYLVAKGSNSGIYLQGMYEIQILDSWGVKIPRAGDNGGIYERWDDSKPEGQKGYQGYAPRQNASRAPGLWQKLKVSFQAPRFDENGEKIENARMLSVELNGVIIHEDVELFGPTRGAMANQEMSRGPIRIQGDHGAVAFRNLQLTPFDNAAPELKGLTYDIYKGRFEALPDFSLLKSEKSGELESLTASISGSGDQFLIRYRGQLDIQEEGSYSFNFSFPGGAGVLSIGGEQVFRPSGGNVAGEVSLTRGLHPLELVYSKVQDWVDPLLTAEIAGPGIRPLLLSDRSFVGSSGPDPILIDPNERPVLRSFMDLPGGYRMTHAVSVASPDNVHYTYDMDYGNLIQIWKGEFLNATPMWYSRGDGSSRPMGTLLYLGSPAFSLAQLSSTEQAWPTDTLGSGYKVNGYRVLSEEHELQFSYEVFGVAVEDKLEVVSGGKGLKRILNLGGSLENRYVRVIASEKIENLGNGLYLVGDKAYYIQLAEEIQSVPILRDSNGQKELLVPARKNMDYVLWF
ncbi:3-keto-disaccharide hydrolase [Cyclobacterium jeungdonense]|uniref:DUF1080 domain-containing protein n=1 Tax=Cyclobacterium jeungdonense TaxID=708087 RepID=A0ABT8C7Z7_9BACT|nr:DUF1080 domain-containing protein [Cyclobacterium jeungdonense]MDN3688646.1 DUF1080 domain-containing protein [Cyclobacterium jeungdonense]